MEEVNILEKQKIKVDIIIFIINFIFKNKFIFYRICVVGDIIIFFSSQIKWTVNNNGNYIYKRWIWIQYYQNILGLFKNFPNLCEKK